MKVWRLGGHGKIASATLEKTTTVFLTPITRQFLTQEKLNITTIFKNAKLLKSLEQAKTYLKSLEGHDKAY